MTPKIFPDRVIETNSIGITAGTERNQTLFFGRFCKHAGHYSTMSTTVIIFCGIGQFLFEKLTLDLGASLI